MLQGPCLKPQSVGPWYLFCQPCKKKSTACFNKILYTPILLNIQLLTIEALDMMWYRPESTNIDRGGVEVNIGILRSISYHVQCLNSQQLLYYIISLKQKKQQQQQNLGSGLCLGQSWISFFARWLTDFIQLQEDWMHTLLGHLSRRLRGELLVYQWIPRLSVRPSVNIFKHLLLWNHWANWTQISYGDSLGWGNESLFKWFQSHDQDGRHAHIW